MVLFMVDVPGPVNHNNGFYYYLLIVVVSGSTNALLFYRIICLFVRLSSLFDLLRLCFLVCAFFLFS
ncbi:hypothetical protein BDF19DRAFT_430169 [Syncephalis fuscata]|nr:hypothetical protein BDF19DRAFT_430169 [Syncephalis fuscata]